MATSDIHSPVRDDSALGPTEDLDRDPDGVPHVVIAAVLVGTFAVAGLVLLALSGHVGRYLGATLGAIVAFPILLVAIYGIAHFRRRAGSART